MVLSTHDDTGRLLSQGKYIDPAHEPAPDPATWSGEQRDAYDSPAMAAYRDGLRIGDKDVRASVLDDLTSYFHIADEEAIQRAINWEQWSVQEWHAKPRDTTDQITDFYLSMDSWCYELLWHAYLQAEGFAFPVSAVLASSVPAKPGMRHLDLGSGVGATSQLFQRLGYETDLADISTSLLKFARHRLERRGTPATFIDLNFELPPADRYDVVTAIYTLAHVPDVAATARMLHRAMRPSAVLFADFDVRPASPENAWHLYSEDLPLRWQLQRAGFEPETIFGSNIIRYRRVDTASRAHMIHGARDLVLLRSPLRPLYRTLKSYARRALRR